MLYVMACIIVFLAAYLVNATYITVFYHRGIAHSAVRLKPWLRTFVVWTGNWITGLDPKGWSCMHRMHHTYSDTERDPHSPVHSGVFPLFLTQLNSYQRTLSGLIGKKPHYVEAVKDLDFDVNWLNKKHLWFLPYLLHGAIAAVLALSLNAWWLGACYWLGMMSHPIQGWMVNALAHTFGYRNYSIDDNSKNNTMVSLLVFGEGYQNNHHQHPRSPKFSVRRGEVDFGYLLCRTLRALGFVSYSNSALVKFRNEKVITANRPLEVESEKPSLHL